mmetsp:Transcript_44670/g.103193  ORF Transcript_44670/g.103193 Transcript_44670/m.103193 type:complete len:362 (+) Transcript_44670:91-1176(+)
MNLVRAGKKALTISTSKSEDRAGRRKTIVNMTEPQFQKLYRLGGIVMDSTHTGMEVRFAERMSDGKEVVIKVRERAKSFKSSSDERDWRTTTEMQLNMPKVECICQFYEVICTPQNYFVCMEKIEGKDLFETIANERLSSTDAREILKQTLEALRVLHCQGRIHKDLKLENIMVTPVSSDGKEGSARRRMSTETPSPTGPGSEVSPRSAKLIDFDTVQDWEPTSPKAKDVLGTDGYIAPEAYDGEYSPASDIYCVGVIMYKLLTRRFPHKSDIFDDKPGENVVGHPAMKRIKERLRQEPIDFTRPPLDQLPVAADLVSKMLAFESADRPSAEEALRHEWFHLTEELLSPTRKPSARPGTGR